MVTLAIARVNFVLSTDYWKTICVRDYNTANNAHEKNAMKLQSVLLPTEYNKVGNTFQDDKR